jgi:dipeptidyl aminopeptidase/acylaminoacyl peptidase
MEAQFSDDGRYLVAHVVERDGASTNKLIRWKCTDWNDQPKTLFASRETGVTSPVFSPDSSTLAYGGTETTKGIGVHFVDPESGETKFWLHRESDYHAIYSIVFSPDGKSIASASGDNKTIVIWDLGTKKPRLFLPDNRSVTKVAFSPKSDLLVGGNNIDGWVRLWDVKTGNRLAERTALDRDSRGIIAFTPDGKLLVTGGEGLLKAWDVAKLSGR